MLRETLPGMALSVVTPAPLGQGPWRAVRLAVCVAIAAAALGWGADATAGRWVATSTPGAAPTIMIRSPVNGGSYERGSRVLARYRCLAGSVTGTIVRCNGSVSIGHSLDTRSVGTKSFTVRATYRNGQTVTRTVHYTVWVYVNPLRTVADLHPSRIDMGVDYSGSGPILAIGRAKIITAGYVPGPEPCWGRTCAPAPGAWIAYRLLDGPFTGKYVYIVENITIKVRAGTVVAAGQSLAVLHDSSPNLEIGWAAGRRAETLAVARGHECSCTDPGGWSSIEGRNFNGFLVRLGAPSGYVTSIPRNQHMPRGWPRLPSRR
jgi:hypothetical protein